MSEDLAKKHEGRLDEIAQGPVHVHRERFRLPTGQTGTGGVPNGTGAGKGSQRRPFNRERYYRNHDRIFGKQR